ncbi:MAG: hypothetical protein U1C04_17315 [Hydrogenophaga sp.]|uniref:hypothetical protein n=1 Tax=Hydrogenophaga sp. TaxID=1904254 RepID=UPI002AB969B1|nr:hypothetical protein [Hydrogenophaga sp.]MDZ4282512.1 hypothetical protein [Hydrogenophaga sp.]
MVVLPTLAPGRGEIVVSFDSEVARMRAPIDIRVLDKPLYLLMPQGDESTIDFSAGVTDVQLTRT